MMYDLLAVSLMWFSHSHASVNISVSRYDVERFFSIKKK